MSGTAGSADVLEALGVRIVLGPEQLGACIREVGIAFLFAPSLHPAMRHVAPVRRELGVRTIFNLVGPLANPAGVRRQVVGVPEAHWVDVVAAALAGLRARHAWVVHGAGGLDELSLDGESLVAEVRDGQVVRRRVRATDLGLAAASAEALRGGSAPAAATSTRGGPAGERGPARDVVVLNAAAAVVVSGRVADLAEATTRAAAAIDDGAAARVLERLVTFTERAA
jgi:anthranilate phosphoribosyltransferase